jgi:hypothetical protein
MLHFIRNCTEGSSSETNGAANLAVLELISRFLIFSLVVGWVMMRKRIS